MNSTKWKISARYFSTYIQFILFSSFFGGLAFLGRIYTRVNTKLLPRYQTVQKCAVRIKPIFHLLEQVKVKFFLGGRGFQKHPGWCLPLLVINWNYVANSHVGVKEDANNIENIHGQDGLYRNLQRYRRIVEH